MGIHTTFMPTQVYIVHLYTLPVKPAKYGLSIPRVLNREYWSLPSLAILELYIQVIRALRATIFNPILVCILYGARCTVYIHVQSYYMLHIHTGTKFIQYIWRNTPSRFLLGFAGCFRFLRNTMAKLG